MKHIVEMMRAFRDQVRVNGRLERDEDRWIDTQELSKSNIEWTLEDLLNIGHVEMSKDDAPILKLSSMKLVWESNTDEYNIYGGFSIQPIYESLANPSRFWKIDFSLANDSEVPAELKHFERLGWFDRQGRGDDWRFGCFLRGGASFPPRIAFFDRNWYTEMNVGFEAYFTAMIASRAVRGWQYFYISWNQEIPHRESAVADMRLAVKVLPMLFPDGDFTYHRDKLAEVLSLQA